MQPCSLAEHWRTGRWWHRRLVALYVTPISNTARVAMPISGEFPESFDSYWTVQICLLTEPDMWHWEVLHWRRRSAAYQKLLGGPVEAAIAQQKPRQGPFLPAFKRHEAHVAMGVSHVLGQTSGLGGTYFFWQFLESLTADERGNMQQLPILLARLRPQLCYAEALPDSVLKRAAEMGAPDSRRIDSEAQWHMLHTVYNRLLLAMGARLQPYFFPNGEARPDAWTEPVRIEFDNKTIRTLGSASRCW